MHSLQSNPLCDPIKVGSTNISILLFADDIVLLSNTKDGLQHCLYTLNEYCYTWHLRVNDEKSNVIIFNSRNNILHDTFTFNNRKLKTVKSYSYLGITLNRNGSFRSAVTILADKALKAYFKIKMTVGLNISCKLLEKLFDTLVSPVLLYGSEIWGTTFNFQDSDPFEHIHLKFIKEILGTHSKSFNAACRAELNRLPLKATALINIFTGS